MWFEVETAKKESRRELVLTTPAVATRIAEDGLDDNIFNLTNLNFLEISKVGLLNVSSNIHQLLNLSNLVLHSNKLTEIPSSLGNLIKLKFLDLSKNELSNLPEEFANLKNLQTLNVSCNKLTVFFDVDNLVNLHVLDISHNQLSELPKGLDNSELSSLLTICANDNKLESVLENISELPNLKTFNVSNNSLQTLPSNLCNCLKLKEFSCIGNKLKDKRLSKLFEQCSTKAVLDYLRIAYNKEQSALSGNKKKSAATTKKQSKATKTRKESKSEDVLYDTIVISHFNMNKNFIVKVSPEILLIRPYIVCCIINNVDFTKSPTLIRRFLNLQTKLHDDICGKRHAATLATHDLNKIKFPLTYEAQLPQDLKIQPLSKLKVVSGNVLVSRLNQEAEELRKEKKRNTVSGIHKYLTLLKDHPKYPCIIDDTKTVISFPPITNSNTTKVELTTKDLLLEVTSSQNLELCKRIMDELVEGILKLNLGTPLEPVKSDDQSLSKTFNDCIKLMEQNKESETVAKSINKIVNDDEAIKSEDNINSDFGSIVEKNNSCNDIDEEKREVEDVIENDSSVVTGKQKFLTVEQVKVVDQLGNLKVVYPSRTDLQLLKDVKVIRNDVD